MKAVMRSNPLIVHLINRVRLPDSREFAPEPAPDRHCIPEVLPLSGLATEVVPMNAWPWNPAERMHEAYGGLDPLRSLWILLRRRKALLICAHLESALIPLLLRRLFRFKVPIVIWEVPWSPGWRYREWINRLAILRADCSVVYSTNQLELMRKTYGPDTPVAFVPFCIDLDFYRPRPTVDSKGGFILSSGVDIGRDFQLLLQATKGMETPVKIKTRALAADLTAHPNVSVSTEYLSYLKYREMYENATIAVVTTGDTPNACGVTSLMEAMAMGKPTIVSDNPALRDYLPPPDAGVVIPIGDVHALRNAINDLLNNPAKAEAMGGKARQFAEQRFNPRVHFEAATNLFLELIAKADSGNFTDRSNAPGSR